MLYTIVSVHIYAISCGVVNIEAALNQRTPVLDTLCIAILKSFQALCIM